MLNATEHCHILRDDQILSGEPIIKERALLCDPLLKSGGRDSTRATSYATGTDA